MQRNKIRDLFYKVVDIFAITNAKNQTSIQNKLAIIIYYSYYYYYRHLIDFLPHNFIVLFIIIICN